MRPIYTERAPIDPANRNRCTKLKGPTRTMLKNWQYFTLVALGAVALILVLANVALFSNNREQQAQINQRQVFLQQTASLEALYREMVKALADLAVRNSDRPVLEALSAQGINVTMNQPAPTAVATPKK